MNFNSIDINIIAETNFLEVQAKATDSRAWKSILQGQSLDIQLCSGNNVSISSNGMALRQCRSHDLPGLPSTAMMNQTLGHWDESLIKERLGEEWHKELASRGFSILGGHDKYVWKHDKVATKITHLPLATMP
ncbi:hypothetical protein GOBAR_DD15814 [Gossypium barbadense]|nr:hypothetical protein GOBAR_DD15814 [Gossypium barbadense]